MLPPLHLPYLLTGSTDEHIRLFDMSISGEIIPTVAPSMLGRSGNASGGPNSGKTPSVGNRPRCIREVVGHTHEVTALAVWERAVVDEGGKGKKEIWIVSSSLDGTVRKWRLNGKSQVYTNYGLPSDLNVFPQILCVRRVRFLRCCLWHPTSPALRILSRPSVQTKVGGQWVVRLVLRAREGV